MHSETSRLRNTALANTEQIIAIAIIHTKRRSFNINMKTHKEKEKKRPLWDEYFMEIADVVCKRSTCVRRKVGAIVALNRRILATGYNGAVSGLTHCTDKGCLRDRLGVPSGERHELCRGLHAEQNALLFAAKSGENMRGAVLYCTNQPCVVCAKMIIQSGICRIVYKGEYPDKLSLEMLGEAGIKLKKIK